MEYLERALSATMQSVREAERARIARELHDELGSVFTSFRWGLEEISNGLSLTPTKAMIATLREKVSAMTTQIEDAFGTVRRISSELRPHILNDLDLVSAISWEAHQFESSTGIACRLNFLDEIFDLSREQSTAVFRIFQEALTNILRHAAATVVDLTIKEEVGEFVFTISDNGRGIKSNETSGTVTLGLLGMRERAHLIGGEIKVAGSAGQGTVVTLRVPISSTTAA